MFPRLKEVSVKEIFNGVTLGTVAASLSTTSLFVDLKKSSEAFALQVNLTEDGTGQFQYQLSIDGVNYVTPASAVDIVTAHKKTSGTGGNEIYPLRAAGGSLPALARYLKIVASNTSGTDNIVVTAHLAFR